MLRPISHLRNALIAVLAIILVLGASQWNMPAGAMPQLVPPAAPLPQTATFTFTTNPITVEPNGSVSATAQLNNTGTVTDTYAITTNIANFAGWSATPSSSSVTLGPGASTSITFLITAPADATSGIALTATATGVATPAVSAFLTVNLQLREISIQLILRDPNQSPQDATPGSTVNFDLRVTNNGNDRETVNLRLSTAVRCETEIPNCSVSLSQSSATLNPNQSADFSLSAILPLDAPVGAQATIGVQALVDNQVRASLDVVIRVIESSPTPTDTNTPEPTSTTVPTLGAICTDIFEDDDALGSAKVIDVNFPQPRAERDPDIDDRRAICPAGDEDWLVFGGVENKVYTIDVRDIALGLDLSLALFTEDGELLTFNDDFFNRDPASPNPNDTAPRIDQWRAPYTGRFYIQVRDVADRGGTDRTYRIEVIDNSYGPTPITVVEVCEDLFEPDGLPEQAPLITSNELQSEKRLCPVGDADWITFFGKEDKRYFIYTDTRSYIENNPANPDAQAGADTVIVLTDRDGLSVIDVNDDIPGGSTLDSQIEFIPEVDGFYFVQVKNIGDIGNQFIRYDLTLELCIPGEDDSACGRTFASTSNTPVPATSTAATATATPTLTDDEFQLDGTATPTPSLTATSNAR